MRTILMFFLMLFMVVNIAQAKEAKAILAGGCFWCVESDMEKVAGVKSVVSGYSGGSKENPTYQNYHDSGHLEVVEVIYDTNIISYGQLLDVFLMKVNPTDSGGQFCDRGSSYRPAIFYFNDEEKRVAEEAKARLSQSGKFDKPVTIELIPASVFYPAEDYHQDYYKKNSLQYKFYRFKCGRDQYLEKIWGKSEGH